MKVLQITVPTAISRFALDGVRAVHIVEVDAAPPAEGDRPAGHVPDLKWLLVVELRAIKAVDPETKQVVDYVQQKEWLFDTKADAEAAMTAEEV